MSKTKEKIDQRKRRKNRVRAKISGTAAKPRLNVFKSNKGMYVQLINDESGLTIASVHSREIKENISKVKIGFEVGKQIAKKAAEKNITEVVFDKSCYKYHGRVEAVANGAREGGLKF